MKNKKGELGGLQGFVLSIVAVAVMLAIGLIVLGEMQGASKELATGSLSNESVTLSSNTGQLSQGGDLFVSAGACRNESSTVLTVGVHCNVSSLGTVTVSPQNHSGLVYIDYTHYLPSAAYNSTKSIITKMATVPTWIGIIIIVALAFIVLSYFMGRRQ